MDLSQELEPYEIHLWHVEVPESSATSLSPRESKACLASGKLITKVLAHYQQFKNPELSFLDNGKPVIKIPGAQEGASPVKDLYCSASHSAHTGVYALSLGVNIGVDIERIKSGRSLQEISQNYFHPQEQSDLVSLKGKAKSERFYQFWTLKEAMGKISGKGISGDFKRFGFHSLSPRSEPGWQVVEELPGFRFWTQRFASEYWLSVAALAEQASDCTEISFKKIY